MKISNRLKLLPPYLFAQLDELKAEQVKKGIKVMDLGIGDPDQPTPKFVVEALQKAAANPIHHPYPPYAGTLDFKKAVAEYYQRRFQVQLNPEKEVLALIGSKEGLTHIFFAVLDEGDYVLLPDPAYPAYKNGVLLAGGKPYAMPLTEENHYLPDLNAIPAEIARQAPLMILNYPHNPTGAVAPKEFLQEALEFAHKYDMIIIYDNAYAEICYDGYQAPSFLELPDARKRVVEFNSLSKAYNMTGWRIAYAVGNAGVLSALLRLKSNIDSGTFTAIQEAGAIALRQGDAVIKEIQKLYQKRRNLVIDTLNALGWNLPYPKATFYIWAPVPVEHTSSSFIAALLKEAAVLGSPGNGFGTYGEGYFRFSLTVPEEVLEEAMRRITKWLKH
jgi:LL-diaminopimelate aminotransferase